MDGFFALVRFTTCLYITTADQITEAQHDPTNRHTKTRSNCDSRVMASQQTRKFLTARVDQKDKKVVAYVNWKKRSAIITLLG